MKADLKRATERKKFLEYLKGGCMIFNSKRAAEWREYKELLGKICALSNLFSESEVPYLYYRVHENMFSKAFNAENLSREDCAFDAKFENIGIGLKTFVNGTGKSFQKVAEFNKDLLKFKDLPAEEQAIKISELRNLRIEFAKQSHSIENCIYHCIARDKDKLLIFEENMDLIDLENLEITGYSGKSLKFKDLKNEYNFNFGKSTLFKKFKTQNYEVVPINILEEPFELLKSLNIFEETEYEYVILPLYSTRDGEVSRKSGLNQWNAGGRKRNINECYIPIPAKIHEKYPAFFPSRDVSFNLLLPNKKELSVKVCQSDDKALMSNPNSALGEWLLRELLHLKEGELATLEHLYKVGTDSVEVQKIAEGKYKMNFMPIGSYKKFLKEKLS